MDPPFSKSTTPSLPSLRKPWSVCFCKNMLFNWTVFWIVLGVLEKIITIIIIFYLCMVGADSSVSYQPFHFQHYLRYDFHILVSQIDNNPWMIRGSAFHWWHFIMKFSASWLAIINVFKWSFLPCINSLRAKLFRGNIKHIFTFHVIPLHWYDTGDWNPSSNKTRTYPFYIVNIIAAGVLATQGART